MRCFLAGSKNLSVAFLNELLRQGHEVVGVLTRPVDDAAMNVWHTQLGHQSLKAAAEAHGVPVYSGCDINAASFQETLRAMDLDVLFSCFFNQMIKRPVLAIPSLGCINLHSALLPKNRGSFPMAWAMIKGESTAGATLHFMTPGVDDGDIVSQVAVEIRADDTGATLYQRVTDAAVGLIRDTLPVLASGAYVRYKQDELQATYHPRGYPFGGYVDPYWPADQAERFRRALHFPPFPGAIEPAAAAYQLGAPRLYVMPGFDCDRPRGELAQSAEGRAMGERKIGALRRLSDVLDSLRVARTYFICGQFLESATDSFGAGAMQEVFRSEQTDVEIAHHSWSHRVLKAIPSRPDKQPMKAGELVEEVRRTQAVLSRVLGVSELGGFRAPLGYFRGLEGEYRAQDVLAGLGFRYVSTDLRGPGGGLYAPLEAQGRARQPYRYCNGLLEVPGHGWQDTSFSGASRTRIAGPPPPRGPEIVDYYYRLFEDAAALVTSTRRDFFLGLVLHPIETADYAPDGELWMKLDARLRELGGTWACYRTAHAAFSPEPGRRPLLTPRGEDQSGAPATRSETAHPSAV